MKRKIEEKKEVSKLDFEKLEKAVIKKWSLLTETDEQSNDTKEQSQSEQKQPNFEITSKEKYISTMLRIIYETEINMGKPDHNKEMPSNFDDRVSWWINGNPDENVALALCIIDAYQDAIESKMEVPFVTRIVGFTMIEDILDVNPNQQDLDTV